MNSYRDIFKDLIEDHLKAQGKDEGEVRHYLFMQREKERLEALTQAARNFRKYMKENDLLNDVVYGGLQDDDAN